jgi:hypothetical protein
MNYKEAFEKVLADNDITWCKACELKGSHKRGFAFLNSKVIHLDRAISTRSTLYRGLHEVGHALDSTGAIRIYAREEIAENYVKQMFKELGIPLPRKQVVKGLRYIQRKKRHGDNIRRGRK